MVVVANLQAPELIDAELHSAWRLSAAGAAQQF
jgi:hypothetical protein